MAQKDSGKGGKDVRDEVRGGTRAPRAGAADKSSQSGKGGTKSQSKSGSSQTKSGQSKNTSAKASSGAKAGASSKSTTGGTKSAQSGAKSGKTGSSQKPASGSAPKSSTGSAAKSGASSKTAPSSTKSAKSNTSQKSASSSAKTGTSRKSSSGSTASRQRTSSGAKAGDQRRSSAKSKGKKNVQRNKVLEASVKLGLVLILIILIVTMWRNRVDWSCANIAQCAQDSPQMVGIGDGFPVSVIGSSVLGEDEMAGGVAVLTDTALTVYNTSSKQVMSRAHYLGSPAMKTAGRYALLIDIGGTKYQLEAISDTLAAGTTDMPIIGSAISRSGSFAIITQGSSYSTSKLSTVEVFGRSGEVLHLWHSGSYYITEAALSADGKYLAMAGLSARDGNLYSCIILHRVGKEGNLAEIELPDTVCFSLEYTNTGSLYAVCSNKLIYIDDNGETVEQYDFSGTIQSYDISYDAGAAVYISHSSDDESGKLTLFDTRGQMRWERELPLHSLAVSLGENGCSVLGRGSMIAYDLIGEKLGKWDAAVSAADVLVLGSRAYVIEGISVSQINLKSGGEE